MLVLHRRVGETLMIGEHVRITVLGFQGRQVRIGIQAPKAIPVHCLEVFERIAAEGRRKVDVGGESDEATDGSVRSL